jgi:hypothetical protein
VGGVLSSLDFEKSESFLVRFSWITPNHGERGYVYLPVLRW